MAARVVAIVALCVPVLIALQPAAIDGQPRNIHRRDTDLSILNNNNQDVEKRYTKELIEDYEKTNNDALLLYTEFTGKAAEELNAFLSNISMLAHDTIASMKTRILDRASRHCRDEFDNGIQRIVSDSHKEAHFCADEHHKYFHGHMIVFRMHLDRANGYIQKCKQLLNDCGIYSETTSQMIRWRRLALHELNRVKDDIQHTRNSYTDILYHSRAILRSLRNKAELNAQSVVAAVHLCVCTTKC